MRFGVFRPLAPQQVARRRAPSIAVSAKRSCCRSYLKRDVGNGAWLFSTPLPARRCKQLSGGSRRSIGIANVAVNQNHDHGAFGEQPNFPRALACGGDTAIGKHCRKVLLHVGLVALGDHAGRMAWQIGKLHRDARESRCRPARPRSPFGQCCEYPRDNGPCIIRR